MPLVIQKESTVGEVVSDREMPQPGVELQGHGGNRRRATSRYTFPFPGVNLQQHPYVGREGNQGYPHPPHPPVHILKSGTER